MATTAVRSVTAFAERVITNVATVIVGKRPQIEDPLVAVRCGGHALLEDGPGTGKTLLARSIAASLGLDCKRIQCTPDLLPNDSTGVSIDNQGEGAFAFQPGPLFTNLLLADEINRATPRARSALLEAMQEGQVTIDGVTRPLPVPFLTLATQNPIEFAGIFPLPEAQRDRFFLRLPLGYPSEDEELTVAGSCSERAGRGGATWGRGWPTCRYGRSAQTRRAVSRSQRLSATMSALSGIARALLPLPHRIASRVGSSGRWSPRARATISARRTLRPSTTGSYYIYHTSLVFAN